MLYPFLSNVSNCQNNLVPVGYEKLKSNFIKRFNTKHLRVKWIGIFQINVLPYRLQICDSAVFEYMTERVKGLNFLIERKISLTRKVKKSTRIGKIGIAW